EVLTEYFAVGSTRNPWSLSATVQPHRIPERLSTTPLVVPEHVTLSTRNVGRSFLGAEDPHSVQERLPVLFGRVQVVRQPDRPNHRVRLLPRLDSHHRTPFLFRRYRLLFARRSFRAVNASSHVSSSSRT